MTLAVVALIWLAWIVLGATWDWRSRHAVDAIPHRFLVSGGRGKTSLVRLIHAGLLAADRAAVARVSGDQPEFIDALGVAHPERRWGPANIRELNRIFHRAKGLEVHVAVVENMAIDPELQSVVANRIVRPTTAIMAPDALDHLEVLPSNRKKRIGLQLQAVQRGTPLLLPGGKANAAYGQCAGELGVPWTEAPLLGEPPLRPHMQILAGLALEAIHQVCGAITDSARAAVLEVATDLQALRVYRRQHIAWIDAWSANDPGAARTICELAASEATRRGYSIEARLFNHRRDRPSRLPLFESLLQHAGPTWIVGEPFPLSWKTWMKAPRLAGSPQRIVTAIEDRFVEPGQSTYILCLGNTGGMGKALRQWLTAHAEVESW